MSWPEGRYGLPQTINGCPSSKGFIWKRGFRYHDTEDDGTENQHSDNFHLASNFTDEGIRHDFCIKDSEVGESRLVLFKLKKVDISCYQVANLFDIFKG